MKQFAFMAVLFVLVVLVVPLSFAQEDGDESPVIDLGTIVLPPTNQVVCGEALPGCGITPLTKEDLELVFPEEELVFPDELEEGEYGKFVCIEGFGCSLVDESVTEEDIQLAMGDKLVFSPQYFDAPPSGTWETVNLTGEFVCHGPMGSIQIEIPEVVTVGTLSSSEDIEDVFGEDLEIPILLGEDADPETLDLLMYQIIPGLYTTSFTLTTPEGEMTQSYYLAMQTEDSFVGTIVGTMNAQGITCFIHRNIEGEFLGE